MGKKNKNKQKGKPLNTQPVTKSVVAPPSSTVTFTPPSATPSVVRPEAAPTFTVPAAAPKAIVAPPSTPKAAPKVELKEGEMFGTVIARTYDSTGLNAIFGRIEASDGRQYTAHSKECRIPLEGAKVKFELYKFQTRSGATSTGAKIISDAIDFDQKIVKRMENLRKESVYRLLQPQDFLNMSGENLEDGNIIGTTPEGLIIYFIKDKRE